MAPLIKQEIVTLHSRTIDGVLMYPGRHLLTWAKTPFMPWILLSLEPMPEIA